MTKDERKRLDAVLAAFPGATYSVEPTKRHERVVVRREGRSAAIVKSKTPQCGHATDNFLGDVKRALRGMK
jgi:hypothetical protein